jgi:hypothetical protein
MSRRNEWLLALGLGALEALVIGIFPLAGYTMVLVTLAVVTRGARMLPGLSGFLTGLGIAWLVLIGGEVMGGGQTSNLAGWVLLGVVPLVIGVVLGYSILSATRAQPVKPKARSSGGAKRRIG